jgi:glycosyltransferase involved in cell wall biosynthesis
VEKPGLPASGVTIRADSVSIIVPTFNGARRIAACLDALLKQKSAEPFEIVVVDDGSTDGTAAVVKQYESIRLIRQNNAGPAAARNHGASEASGSILLFTDDDCVPATDWLDAMVAPFHDPGVVGTKGAYRTRQTRLIARFVQIEYEDRYRLMARYENIDFVDTYSAAFRRERFLEMGGYDTSFPVACAEDADLSYRMSARGWAMKFITGALVYHTHPDRLSSYIKKKYKFAFWRMLAVRKNPRKGIKDSHTPQIMKLQLLFLPAFAGAAIVDLFSRRGGVTTALVVATFLLSTLPFTIRAFRKDPVIGVIAPILLALRACAQFLGAFGGVIHAIGEAAPENVDSRKRGFGAS